MYGWMDRRKKYGWLVGSGIKYGWLDGYEFFKDRWLDGYKNMSSRMDRKIGWLDGNTKMEVR